jgi:hypothetical protein
VKWSMPCSCVDDVLFRFQACEGENQESPRREIEVVNSKIG